MRPTSIMLPLLALAIAAPESGHAQRPFDPGYVYPPPPPLSGEVLHRRLFTHCGHLIWQFDGAAARLIGDRRLAAAKDMRNRAERLCNRGKPEEGVPLMETALNLIGINPIGRP